jgi:hypothetical protein
MARQAKKQVLRASCLLQFFFAYYRVYSNSRSTLIVDFFVGASLRSVVYVYVFPRHANCHRPTILARAILYCLCRDLNRVDFVWMLPVVLASPARSDSWKARGEASTFFQCILLNLF